MNARDAERLAARLIMIGFDGASLAPEAASLLDRGAFGAILFTRNYVDAAQVRELCASIKARGPVAIAVDHEGGPVQRFRGEGFSEVPPMREIGALPPRDAEARASAIGATFARELRPLGIDIDFAPVLDVDSNPANPVIGARSFSSDPAVVARLGCALLAALQAGGVAACAKHFPGHGDTDVDSHLELPRLPHPIERLREVELVPFAAACRAGVASVMTSHIVFSALDRERPATMSEKVLRVLRDELRYDGVVVSDDLEMKAIASHFPGPDAALSAVAAGCDLLLSCHSAELQEEIVAALARAIRDGSLSRDRVREAHRRLDTLAARYVREVGAPAL